MTRTTIENFDPNKINQTQMRYATYSDRRSPGFKVHYARGHALNALKNHDQTILYVYDDSTNLWVEVVRRDSHKCPDYCEGCLRPGTETRTDRYSSRQYTTKILSFSFERDARGKIPEPVTAKWLCPDCIRTQGF